MTSTTMSLLHFNTTLHGKPVNPESLNNWLDANGGYVDQNLLVWGSVEKLGTMKVDTILTSPDAATVHSYINRCQPVIMHGTSPLPPPSIHSPPLLPSPPLLTHTHTINTVRDNTHFVLGIGYDSENPNTIYVNDPGFTDDSYDLSGVTETVIYERA